MNEKQVRDALKQERDALIRYGQHEITCFAIRHRLSALAVDQYCDCGFSEACERGPIKRDTPSR